VGAVAALASVALMAAPSWAATVACTGPTGAVEINGNVSAGPGCDLSGATVKGNVTVNPGGSLSTKAGSTTVITGNVESTKATQITLEGATSVGNEARLRGTTEQIHLVSGKVNGNLIIEGGVPFLTIETEKVGGNLQVLNTSGAVLGELGLVGIVASTVGGNLEVANNSLTGAVINDVSVEETSIGGNLTLSNNSATGGGALNRVSVQHNHVGNNALVLNNTAETTTVVLANAVGNNLNCEGNKPPPVGEGNTAAKKLGQCKHL
jgi:hypothetical protein